jgi:hypothetical protein
LRLLGDGLLDLVSRQWSTAAELNGPRSGHVGTAVDGGWADLRIDDWAGSGLRLRMSFRQDKTQEQRGATETA